MAREQKTIKPFILRFSRDKNGAVAIEFSLMMIPYLMLTLGIIELSLMYASASMMEGATSSAARLIRTGQVQSASDPVTTFRDQICEQGLIFISCNDVSIDVLQMDSFSDFDALAAQFDEDGNMVSQGFDAGGSGDRVLVRTAARYSMMTPFIGNLLAGSNNSILMMSTIVLQTEPYEFDPDS